MPIQEHTVVNRRMVFRAVFNTIHKLHAVTIDISSSVLATFVDLVNFTKLRQNQNYRKLLHCTIKVVLYLPNFL